MKDEVADKMAKSKSETRKDSKGRILHKGECEREKYNDYVYQYYDVNHNRRSIYGKTLLELREKEKQVQVDMFNGIDTWMIKKMSFNEAFDRYIKLQRPVLDKDTYNQYRSRYDLYVRNGFGRRKIGNIKYSDVKDFYNTLAYERGLKTNTINNINTLIHPVFAMLVRDQLLKVNPSDGVMAEIKKTYKHGTARKCALSIEQQRRFVEYARECPVYEQWFPMIIVLLGTGCRIGEALALRWDDLDMVNRQIHIRHAVKYRKNVESGHSELHISLPKTQNGVRMIPMIDEVYEAFERQKQYQRRYKNVAEIDGYTGFVFTNKGDHVYLPASVYKRINEIGRSYNEQEVLDAIRENREPVFLPNLGCHSMRHTFCTRFCETESNVKVLQEIVGHSNIITTMNVYTEVMEEKKKEAMEKLGINMKIL